MATASLESPRINVKAAAQAATAYFGQLYPNVHKFSLEEVEMTEDEKYWLITLGFEVAGKHPHVPAEFLPPTTKYKVFKVNAANGKVVSMKIRPLR